MRKSSLFILAAVTVTTLLAGCGSFSSAALAAEGKDENVVDSGTVAKGPRYVGTRSSYYGFNTFPTPEQIGKVFLNMSEMIPGSTPSSVWIVGGISGSRCRLEFPSDGNEYDNISFFSNLDKHEEYLTEFDRIGAKVFLQVEAGMANMEDLIKLVMERYKHHPSVIGFGADIEWYPSEGTTNGVDGGLNVKLTNSELKKWDDLVKSYNPSYRIFVKHWLKDYCGEGPVSDVIYIDDSQNVSPMETLISEFRDWADYFKPNDVGFQIGYPNDTTWWRAMDDPIREITQAIDDSITDQINHIYWVDFTIEESKFDTLWQ